jgi:hypothetical protein
MHSGPIGHGEVICFTIYCGDDVDFGTGVMGWGVGLCCVMFVYTVSHHM